jgi:hypothetical protein
MPGKASPATKPLPASGKRTALVFTGAGIAMLLILLAVGLFTAGLLIHSDAPQTVAHRVHQWLSLARPAVLLLQLAALALIWWQWERIVKSARFAGAVEAAWLAARDRMVFWGLAMIGLSVFLWSA